MWRVQFPRVAPVAQLKSAGPVNRRPLVHPQPGAPREVPEHTTSGLRSAPQPPMQTKAPPCPWGTTRASPADGPGDAAQVHLEASLLGMQGVRGSRPRRGTNHTVCELRWIRLHDPAPMWLGVRSALANSRVGPRRRFGNAALAAASSGQHGCRDWGEASASEHDPGYPVYVHGADLTQLAPVAQWIRASVYGTECAGSSPAWGTLFCLWSPTGRALAF